MTLKDSIPISLASKQIWLELNNLLSGHRPRPPQHASMLYSVSWWPRSSNAPWPCHVSAEMNCKMQATFQISMLRLIPLHSKFRDFSQIFQLSKPHYNKIIKHNLPLMHMQLKTHNILLDKDPVVFHDLAH